MSIYDRKNISSGDICDGCMNGCSLNQPGCQRGMEKARGTSQTPRTLADALQAHESRERELAENMQTLRQSLEMLFSDWPGNYVPEEAALLPELAGMQIFDRPIFGISNAFDPLYRELKKTEAVGPWHKLPGDWLRGAKRVISIFFPYTEQVRKNQKAQVHETTPEWLHGRIEGHEAMLEFAGKLCDLLRESGHAACIPIKEPGFAVVMNGKGITGYPGITDTTFGSAWSERHVAYISGLGTFGLSRGLITERGMAGRFCSIVTDMLLPVTERTYTRIDEWCTKCGMCAQRCPVKAISKEEGKNHIPCGARIEASKKKYAPRYGCGQCQTGVPCESGRP